MIIYTNSFSFYKYIIKFSTIKEKRLMIDIITIKQLYERKKLLEIRWITNNNNSVNIIIKSIANKLLKSLININHLSIKIQR